MVTRRTKSIKRWVVGIALTLGFLYFTSTPQFTLIQISDAFEAHDLPTFEKYVDIDGLVETVVRQYAAASKPSLRHSELAQRRLTRSLRQQLIRFVETGLLRSEPLTAEIVPDIGTLRNRFQGVDYLRVAGDTAYIGLQTRDDMGVFEILMHRKGWFWRVDAVNDCPAYWRRTVK